ncbi:hypothetical protein LPJ66_006972 [Kickxella alabastrina]|uniref:Uncharacterized protein n=1 Tax=Kickxella alabastrina TaxID=61397 RepID=A0ACC1ICH5_9FUNG|nr:hypothetical protein LPJ66_006972 [Kickxella alabastrina]
MARTQVVAASAAAAVDDDDENFELVDYTAASSWERFVASIETKLCQWRVNDGRKGGLDIAELSAKCQHLFIKHKQYKDAVTKQISEMCTRTARLSYKGASYALTLSVHPLMAAQDHRGADGTASKQMLFDSQFPAVHVPELEVDHIREIADPAWHPLHRWTGNSIIIYWRYLGDESDWENESLEGTDDYSVSLETAKLLMSSMNIAAQNVRCQLPMFVPVGDAWRCLFTGRAIGRAEIIGQQPPGNTAVVVRKFESVSLPQSPNAYLQLNGLLELFATSFRVLAYAPRQQLSAGNASSGSAGAVGPGQGWDFLSKAVDLAALHEYRIKNTYSREWNSSSLDFRYHAGDLNVGPANDPLRVICLKALFQRAPCGTYIDPQLSSRDRLYLKTATAWLLSAQMFPADRERTMLTEALEDAFAAWAQSSSEANRHRHLSLPEQMEAHEEITSDMLIDLFGPSTAPHITPPGLDIDTGNQQTAEAFAARLEQTFSDVYADADPQSRPPSAAQLISRMPHGAAVPSNSLLWRLSEIILVATAKQSTNFWRAPSIMTFLRLLWSMALKEIRWRWENTKLLPRIPTSEDNAVRRDGATSGAETPTPLPPNSSQTANSAIKSASAHFSVHLRYSLVYQKLEMLNCCLERKLMRDGPPIDLESTMPHSALGRLALDSPAEHISAECPNELNGAAQQAGNETDSLAQRIRAHVKDQIRKRIGEGGVELGQRAWAQSSRIRRPIGRLLNTMHFQDGNSGESPESPVGEIGEFEEIRAGPYASDSEGFVSAEDIDYDDNDATGEIVAEDMSALSSAVSVRLPANAVIPGSAEAFEYNMDILAAEHSASDTNYVDLAISSSMDSTSGFHHVSDVYQFERPSVMASGMSVTTPSPPAQRFSASTNSATATPSSETTDPPQPEQQPKQQESVGGLYQSDSMRLLETDQPMWIPKIQLPPVLTEDMLREREAILIGFGTSNDGAKQRAQLQCAELISDMESFKAANPGCVLADFVRWHSPRDWVVPEGSLSDKDGSLSMRMSGGGDGENLWLQLWSEAKPIPADKQKPLFDYEMEAEKALHYLEGIPIYSLFSSLLPSIFLITYERLYRQPIAHRLESLRERLCSLGKKIAFQVNWSAVDPESSVFSSIMDDLEDLEVQTSRCVSLLHKFPEQYSLVEALVGRGQAMVEDRKVQKIVLKALSKYNISTVAPACREYAFTSNLLGLRPDCGASVNTEMSSADVSVHQRMYVTIEEDKSIRVSYTRVKTQGSF